MSFTRTDRSKKRKRMFDAEMWQRWHNDRIPQAHASALRSGIGFLRRELNKSDRARGW